jgi:alpha-D-xyloside xylohydrolase
MGNRAPNVPMSPEMTGGPNEIWSFGDEAYKIMRDYIFVRERLRPYLHAQAAETSRTGIPIMRPLLVEFPEDPSSWDVDDQFMFGRDMMVAPVLQPGATDRAVYLPAGAEWTNAWTGGHMPGGALVTVEAPLERIPLFYRDGARLPIAEP